MYRLGFVLLLAAFSLDLVSSKCQHPRDYGKGSVVCVCSLQHKCTQGDFPADHAHINNHHNIMTSFRTTKSGDRFSRHEHSIKAHEDHKRNFTIKVTIDSGRQFQSINGFGGAFTDSTGYNLAQLPKEVQEWVMRDYFGKDGLGYNVVRIPVGGTDFSNRPYSLDDHADDDNLEKFALQKEDFDYKLHLIHKANSLATSPIKYFASTWSPPAWMKTHDELEHGGYLKGVPGGKYYKLYAKYLVRFLEEYKKQNVSMWGLTVVNEPTVGNANYTWNDLQLNATQQRDFVKFDLGPGLRESGFSALKLMVYDDSVPQLPDYVGTILSDPEAAKFVSGIAFHWYLNIFTPQGDNLDKVAKEFPDKFLLSTEACSIFADEGVHVVLGSWVVLETYAKDIILDLNHHTTGWVDWNMALDLEGGPTWAKNFVDSPIIVNATSGEYYKQPSFYAMGHFSRFVLPESRRINHQVEYSVKDDENQIYVTVFRRPDGLKVATVLNRNEAAIRVELHDPSSGFVNVEMQPSSLETFIWH